MNTQPSGQLTRLGPERERVTRPYGRSLLATTLIVVLGFLAGSSSPAQAAPLDRHCVDDICRKVEWIDGQLRVVLTVGQSPRSLPQQRARELRARLEAPRLALRRQAPRVQKELAAEGLPT